MQKKKNGNISHIIFYSSGLKIIDNEQKIISDVFNNTFYVKKRQ